jgi:asparagine synthase (glutamine-hydrolysing)
VSRLPAGHSLVRAAAEPPRVVAHWSPPRFEEGRSRSLEDAADVLLALLTRAVHERLDDRQPTAVWLSGGYDSPAVFGSAMRATNGDASRVRSVCISYPEDDPGREDELIHRIANRWNAMPLWIDSRSIDLLQDAATNAAIRDEAYAHVFEHWNRSLARASRQCGARVALHGNGGDQLFQVSLIYLADLARQGRLVALARECRARGVRDLRTFFRWAIQPTLPQPALTLATLLRGGRRLTSYLERRVPVWITPAFARRHHLHERARVTVARRPGETFGGAETRWYLSSPFFPRVYASVSALARSEGVELRSPLMDQRVIAFAAAGAREERASGHETKRALRAAVRGLIPDEVLAPRTRRTGTTGHLFASALRQHGARLVDTVTRESRLADLGIVEPSALREGWREWQRTLDGNLAVALFLTVQTELWTRAHERQDARPGAPWSAMSVESSASAVA